ncbi:hypothetical protein PR048_007761 [Dryococelus australis]|uniref:C2 domain-containing protein n=1 Tax=Dryococelus australis TaxID=614101 RepID=A0ABQ9HV63_9NEOP|nr:hypothetical protein PR048_007761 [Dryococelus australis]
MMLSSVHAAIQDTEDECVQPGAGSAIIVVRALRASQDCDSDCFELHSLKVVGSVNSHTTYVPEAQDPRVQWKEVLKIEHKMQFNIRKTNVLLEPYGKRDKIKHVRIVNLHCTAGNRGLYLDFYIDDFNSVSLLGLPGCVELSFVQGVNSISKQTKCQDSINSH